MKKKIALATLSVLPLAAGSVYASGQTGIVTATSLNIRSGAGTNYAVLFTVKQNEQVNITQTTSGWYKIKTSAGKEGWASSDYIKINSSNTGDDNDQNAAGTTKVVNTNGLNMRSGAGTSYRVITVLNKGTKVEVLSESNGWSKIKYDGRLGYVSSQYLDVESSNNVSTTKKEVTASSLNVRSGAGTNYGVIGSLAKGAKVDVISESNGWSKLNYNGKIGYVSSSYLKNVSGSTDSGSGSTTPSQPDNTETVKETKEVTASSLNVRSGAGTNYSSIGKLSKGTKVGVYSESNGWSKIDFNGKVAYVSSEYLKSVSDSGATTPSEPDNTETVKETKQVSCDTLNVRSGAGTSYQAIGKLYKGNQVGVYSESNGWSKIDYNGKVAYVSSEYLKSVSDSGATTPSEPDNTETVKETKQVSCDTLNVRSGAGTSYQVIGKLYKGNQVGVYSESNGWSKIDFNGKVAYVSSEYLGNVDDTTPEVTPPPVVGGEGSQVVNGATINYKALNYTLAQHVSAQLERVSLGGNVIDSSKPRMVSAVPSLMSAQSRAFVPADKSDLEYFLNPANFTGSQKGMMQFLRIDSYKGGVTASELNSYLNSLAATSPGYNVFYNQGQAFINAAQKYNIDLVYLVSHAMWETGYGKSVLAKGQTITSYKGEALPEPVTVYNFFGIGAIDASANVSGAEAAYSNGWTSVEATIDGSAKWIASNYIKSSKYNQNTIYKMKFNYDYTWHQYATDVNWANGISGIMTKLIGMYDTGSNLTFDVPQYK